MLLEDEVLVRCEPLEVLVRCAAEAVLDVPADTVWALVEDPSSYPGTYPTIAAAQRQSDGTWAVDVRLPWPMPHWPLTVEAERVDHDGFRAVQLTDLGGGAGVWRQATIAVHGDHKRSLVQWTWEGPAHYPSWARPRIHRTFGKNAVWALALAVNATPRTPPR